MQKILRPESVVSAVIALVLIVIGGVLGVWIAEPLTQTARNFIMALLLGILALLGIGYVWTYDR